MEDEIKQPNYALRVIPVGNKFKRGPDRLQALGFDPIGNLVNLYEKLSQEVIFWENIRDGKVITLLASGKPRAYNHEAHLSCYDKMIKIGSDLTRYGYSRVPEGVDPTRPPAPPMVVNLTPEGDTFIINGGRVIEHEPDGN